MLWRLIKAAITVVFLAIVAVFAAAWIGLDRIVKRTAADAAVPWEKRLSWERVSTRLLPPSAVLEDAVLVNAEGDELLRAERIALPLLPGAWTKRGARIASPRLEEWTLTLDVPREDAANWAEAVTGSLPKLEWWRGSDGVVEIRFAGGGEVLRFEDVRARRRKYSLRVEGRVDGVPGSSARLEGAWDPAGKEPAVFELEAGPFEAAPWTGWIVPSSEGRVRGGLARLSGTLTFPGRETRFDGELELRELLLEGADATPGPIESLLHRGGGTAELPLTVEGPFAAGSDWRARTQEAVRASANRAHVTATR